MKLGLSLRSYWGLLRMNIPWIVCITLTAPRDNPFGTCDYILEFVDIAS